MNNKKIILIILIVFCSIYFSGCNEKVATEKSSESDSEEVIVNKKPTVYCSPNVYSGTAPLSVNFTCTAVDPDGEIVSYFWDFDDGTNSSEQNPSHTYLKTGTYEVTLTVYDNSGDSTTKTKKITVKVPKPVITEHNAYYSILDSVIVAGVIENIATTTVKFVKLKITFYDSAGNVIKTNEEIYWDDIFLEYQKLYTYAQPTYIESGGKGIFHDYISDVPYYDHYGIEIIEFDVGGNPFNEANIEISDVQSSNEGYYDYSVTGKVKNIGTNVLNFDLCVIFYDSQGNFVTADYDMIFNLYAGQETGFGFRIDADGIDANKIVDYEIFV